MDSLKQAKLISTDYLKYNARTRAVAGTLVRLLSSLQGSGNPNDLAEKLLRMTFAARLLGRERSHPTLERRIMELTGRWSSSGFDWDRFFPNSQRKLVQKAIILKRPSSGGEKGVLFVAFEDNWLRLLRYGNVEKLATEYDLVLSPTWSPPYDLPFLIAYRMWPSTLFTILSNFDDVPVFARLTPQVVTVPLLASSWVHPATFGEPPKVEKKFDIVILATFVNYKRHFDLFRAISRMSAKPRVLVLGHAWGGRSKAVIQEEARLFGVLDRVTIAEALPDKEMIEMLQSAKVSVIMSLAEGACVAVAESLFAGVPVALIQGANVGSRAFINDQTGCFLRLGHISQDLESFIARAENYRPREWMLANRTSHLDSTRILNAALKRFTLEQGRPWTTDLAVMHWRPNAEFDSDVDRENMRTEYARFEAEFGIPVQLAGPKAAVTGNSK